MAGRSGRVAFAVLALALASTVAGRAILSVQGGAQYDLEDAQHMHRRLMADLKTAQEKAGIFVDDAHLFTQPLRSNGRQLKQVDVGSVFSNPTILTGLLSLLSQNLNVGAFPGAALNLPGGSPFGYSPTDDSYCLFATQPYSGAPSPASLQPGSPLPSGGGLPGAFACVDAASNPPASSQSFTVSYNGKTYVCQGAPGMAPAPLPFGRKLQQAESPAEVAIGNALSTIGLPIWNCVVATTPSGNTTLGQATEAVLNDLGVLAEHLLVYLNSNGELTYQQNIKNNFVSLANPLYPTGPRLNISIDFATVTKDEPLFAEIFRQPAPPSPPTVASPPGSSTTGPATSTGITQTQSGGSGGQSSGGPASSAAAAAAGVSSQLSANAPAVAALTPSAAAVVPQVTTLAAFDGYLDNCQTVIGSAPHADGNFDRTNNFTTVIRDGISNMTMDTVNQFAGQVAYVIPASKAVEYVPLTLSTRKSAQFCYDTATLQPVYNPLATFITPNATGMAASPASTVVAFGQAYGLTADALTQALCINVPAGKTLSTYDALGAATNGSGEGLAVLKKNVQLANLVTGGANLLTNDTTTYASYAIILDQAIGKKILYSAPSQGRRLQQAPAPAAACAVDLTNATTLASIITIAQQSVSAQPDESTRAALLPGITPAQISAAATAIANLNTIVGSAPGATETELGQYYAEAKLAPQVSQLATGEIPATQFTEETTPAAINTALAGTPLPGQLVPTPILSPATTVTPVTESSTTDTKSSSSSSGLSHSGKVALATVLPIVGVIAIVAAVAYYISRRNNSGVRDSSNNSAVWWRRPFARSGGPASPIAGSSSTV